MMILWKSNSTDKRTDEQQQHSKKRNNKTKQEKTQQETVFCHNEISLSVFLFFSFRISGDYRLHFPPT